MRNLVRKNSSTGSYLDQFKQKHVDEFSQAIVKNREQLERKVDEEVRRLYEEFETHKRLRTINHLNQNQTRLPDDCLRRCHHAKRPASRLLNSKFSSNPKPFHFAAPSRLDSIQNGCNQVKEKVSS